MKKKFKIPLYGGNVTVHVSNDMDKTLNAVGYDGEIDCDACCVYNTDGIGGFDLIFKFEQIEHGIIAHECFHLTMRIMNGIKKTYDINNDEPEAYLNQYITTEVYSALKAGGITVK